MKSAPGRVGTTRTTRGGGGAPIRIPTETCADAAGAPNKINAAKDSQNILLFFMIFTVFLSSIAGDICSKWKTLKYEAEKAVSNSVELIAMTKHIRQGIEQQ